MKYIIKFSLFFIILYFVQADAQRQTTMYACCSPYGLCDLRLFDGLVTCQQICGGHNKCVAKTVNVIAHPLYGMPVAHVSPNTSAFITGITSEGSSLATVGAEAAEFTGAPRKLEISIKTEPETKNVAAPEAHNVKR